MGCFCWNYLLKYPSRVAGQVFSLPENKNRNKDYLKESIDEAYEIYEKNKNYFDFSDDKWKNSPLKDWIGEGENSTRLCINYAGNVVTGQVFTIVSMLFVVVVNSVLRYCIYGLINFERKKSGTNELKSLVVKIFIAQFLNTAIIILLVNMNLKRWEVDLELFNGVYILGGEYDFFSIKWYSIIGVSIVITMIINIISGISGPIMSYIISKLKIWYDRGYSKDIYVTRQKTMTDLQNIYTGDIFYLELSYAWTLNTFYVCLMYCVGCPILLLILFVSFFIKYWCDKIGFLRVYRTPNQFDSSLPQYVTSVMPWSLIIHLIFSLMLFCDKETFQV